ncbi:hypothetical protein RJ640_022002 [Escallonia rubra]|uniref:Plus3 domain-containing protein n=1 Tax=Escallonia rubra TaxID=112253 RepID=A0AA88U6T8_9ASTE|nr:hypothetical protein RJ640_022002 [Escallonia rubra]
MAPHKANWGNELSLEGFVFMTGAGLGSESKFWFMMNVENSEMDLGLALGSSSKSIRTRLNYNSGAGVNAGSGMDMKYVPTDPLSELVWSSHKGLSLKCADSNLTEKGPSLPWDLGPREVVRSPSCSVGTNDDKRIHEGNLAASQPTLHVDSEAAKVASSTKSSSRNAAIVLGCLTGQEYLKTTDFLPLITSKSRPDIAMTQALSGQSNREREVYQNGRIDDVASPKPALGLEIALVSEVQTLGQHEALDTFMPTLRSLERGSTELSLAIEESKNKPEAYDFSSATRLEKLESSSENDVHHHIGKDAFRQKEEILLRDNPVPVESSPIGRRILLCKRKSKEKKPLFTRDTNGRMSESEDDSHGSMESCNSAGLFSKGRKRGSFEQQLIAQSKRMKKQVQEFPVSTSVSRQDSSFMNWISNMVKGLAKTNQDEGPPLALALVHPNHGLERCDHETAICNKNIDSGSRNMGFQNIFQAMSSRNMKVHDDYPVGGSKELLADKASGANVTPISCFWEGGKSCKQFLVSNESNLSTSGSEGRPSNQPCTVSTNVAATHATCMTNFAEDNINTNLTSDKAIDIVLSSNSSPVKQKAKSAENNYLDPSSEGKAKNNTDSKGDPLGSLWITRYTPKFPCPVLKENLHHQNKNGILECSTECTALIPWNPVNFNMDRNRSGAKEYSPADSVNDARKELQNHVTSTEASIGFKRSCAQVNQMPVSRDDPLLPSKTFKSTEAMASVFAKRLDAIKHIIPSNIKDDAASTRTTCFFCGRSGHNLRDCAEVKEGELKGLLRNVSLYDGAEDTPCLCIRCFQLDHWAIACSVASSSRQQQSGQDASFADHQSVGKVELHKHSRRFSTLLQTKEGNPPSSGLDDAQKGIATRSAEDDSKENHILPLCSFDTKQLSDAPQGMFDTIRRLRLSRVDILKWKKSHNSFLHLDGFYLRLRLGKLEGVGGTGYYVACVNGKQSEDSPRNSKSPISVAVGGIKCLVESQYVSNNDFLEDELKTWWRATSRSGEIPTENYLKSKVEERKKLGL